MANETPAKSNAPLLIIGAVLIAALIGGWYFLSSKPAPTANNGVKPTPGKTSGIPTNAPPGANPPNQAGSPTAAVTVEEFADFQCPQCGAKHPVMNEIKSMYGSRIRFIFRNFPLKIPQHDKAYDAAVAAEAAHIQGKFWEMQNLLFTNQQAWTASPTYKQIWKDYATRIGLDTAKWENDMIGIAAKGRVDQDIARGNAIGVGSTPTIYINGVNVGIEDMTVDGMKRLIDAALAASAPAKPQQPAETANSANTNK